MHINHALGTLATLSVLLMTGMSSAQDAGPGRTLPDICKSSTDNMGAMGSMGSMNMDSAKMDQGHQDMMAGMDEMNKNMMQGMMAPDVDVAFACGMIPHHQGAIDMARAELQHGDDQWAKDKAQQVIDAQEKEIAELTDWLNKQSK